MPIVDFHAHIFPDALAPAAVPALEAAGELTATFDGTVGGLLASMDRCGIDVTVVQPVATKASQVEGINDWVATLASERIVPFGAMHPRLADPAEEIARMASLGLAGFKMHPEHQSFEPHDPALEPIWAAAVEHSMIVFFHAGADVIHPTVHGTPESFATLLNEWPDLRSVLAHMGGFREWEGVLDHIVGKDVWLDTAYTPGHLADENLCALARAHGVDRVLFGSDTPWTDQAVEVEKLRAVGLTDDELDAVLGGNAARILGL